MGGRAEEEGVVSGRRSRGVAPRRERITISVGRGTAQALALVGAVGVIGVFGLGVAVGVGRQRGAGVVVEEGLGTAPGPGSEGEAEIAGVVVPSASRSTATATATATATTALAFAFASKERSAEPKPELAIRVGAPSTSSRYGIQLGAYPDLAGARAFVAAHAARLRRVKVHVIPTEIEGRGVWYRVRIGAFASKGEAEAARKRLPAPLGAGSIVVGYR